MLISRGDVGKSTGFANRLANRGVRDIGGAGAAFSRVLIDRDSDTPVVGVFQVLHITMPRRCRQTDVMADSYLSLIDAAPASLLEGKLDEVFQRFAVERFSFGQFSHSFLRPVVAVLASVCRMIDFRRRDVSGEYFSR